MPTENHSGPRSKATLSDTYNTYKQAKNTTAGGLPMTYIISHHPSPSATLWFLAVTIIARSDENGDQTTTRHILDPHRHVGFMQN